MDQLGSAIVLHAGSLLYRPTSPKSADSVTYLPNVSFAYLSPAAALEDKPEMTPVPFLCQRDLRILATSMTGLIDLCASDRFWPRTRSSVFVFAARIAQRERYDGVTALLPGQGMPDAVFLLSPEKAARRVAEAFQA